MGESFDEIEAKKSINNFLWTALPGGSTIYQAETIALEFLERLRREWKKRTPAEPQP